MTDLPRWAADLVERHPDAEMPTRDNPIPDWLAEETRRMPLWYIIRGADHPRHEHPFLLHGEIHRQPGQWREIVASRWGEVKELAESFDRAGVKRVITTGCGSAFFTAMHGEFTIPRIAGLPATAIESFELQHYFPDVDPSTTLVIGHSGTGGSIETVEAMQAASDRGCHTLAMTNTVDTAVERASGQALTYVTEQRCGPCTSVVSTRVLLQTMLAVAMAEQRTVGNVDTTVMRKALDQVADVGAGLLDRAETDIAGIANRYQDAEAWLLVGSGVHYFSAREGTLKIEEQAILVGKAYRTGDFHHDALSLVDPRRVVVGIEGGGAANDRVVDALRAANEGGSPTVAVCWSSTAGAEQLAEVADHALSLAPALPELQSAIPMTLLFQLLGYYLGVARGFNPDTLRTDHEPNTRAWLTSFPLGTH